MNELILNELGISKLIKKGFLPSLYVGDSYYYAKGEEFTPKSPIDLQKNLSYRKPSKGKVSETIQKLKDDFNLWQEVPAPKRGEAVRVFGNLVREKKEQLAFLITLESGKIYEEALGEVQEMIDVCDFAVGLSRQLYGLSIASERFRHKIIEQWHPLGVVGVISAFNFPMAVWAWNATVALVCGNTLIWKPSTQTPLCAIACHLLLQEAIKESIDIPLNISAVLIANRDVSDVIVQSRDVRLVSATGSVAMGKALAPKVASRLGRLLLELGGNNAMIVTPSADLELTKRAVLFSAVGTAGQRCTSLRRLFIHKSIAKKLTNSLIKAYKTIRIGDPFADGNLMGPLIGKDSFETMQGALKEAKKQGGKILYGGDRVSKDVPYGGYYVYPTLVKIKHDAKIVQTETFAPILYIIEYEDFDKVLAWHNDVPQGLSSAIFTNDIKESEAFMSARGSDCGIANVNIGTSGAEIGGAFGGEKDTGGGRESGSDSWKNYMRRVTNTVNYSDEMPLSQGINFG
jgi:aldehyde dehydrogenase (NAD+)